MLFFVVADFFFSINFFLKKFSEKYHWSVKQLGSRSGSKVGPDLGPKGLQSLSEDDNSGHQQAKSYANVTKALYSKTCLKRQLKNRQNKGLNTKW